MFTKLMTTTSAQTLTDFVSAFWPPAMRHQKGMAWERITGDGSDRTFVRISAGKESVLLVHGQDKAENRAYELIGRHFWNLDRIGPEILAVDQTQGLFLVEYLGDFRLQDWARASSGESLDTMYREVVRILAGLHAGGLEHFDPKWCYQTTHYDKNLIIEHEIGYFLSAFLVGLMNLPSPGKALEREFDTLADAALDGVQNTLMHRDFQSRNIMIKEGQPRIIDFQGARIGPPGYDLASLLFDPYTRLNDPLRERLLTCYLDIREEENGFDREGFLRNYYPLAACRLLQALGAYGFLTEVKGKFLFEKYIPQAVRNLHSILSEDVFDFAPKLRGLVKNIGSGMGKTL